MSIRITNVDFIKFLRGKMQLQKQLLAINHLERSLHKSARLHYHGNLFSAFISIKDFNKAISEALKEVFTR